MKSTLTYSHIYDLIVLVLRKLVYDYKFLGGDLWLNKVEMTSYI